MIFVGALPLGGGGGVSSGDVAAAIAAERASIAACAGGLPLTLAATLITGDGTDQERSLSHAHTLVDGGYYRISDLVITVRTSGVFICSTTINGHVARYSSSGGGSWATDTRGTVSHQTGADVLDFFDRSGLAYAATELPGLAYTAGALSVGVPLRSGETAIVTARGTIAYLGTTL